MGSNSLTERLWGLLCAVSFALVWDHFGAQLGMGDEQPAEANPVESRRRNHGAESRAQVQRLKDDHAGAVGQAPLRGVLNGAVSPAGESA
jgi:hypothetical protein